MNALGAIVLALGFGVTWSFLRLNPRRSYEGPEPRETALRDKLIDLNTQLGSGEIDQDEFDRRHTALVGRKSG